MTTSKVLFENPQAEESNIGASCSVQDNQINEDQFETRLLLQSKTGILNSEIEVEIKTEQVNLIDHNYSAYSAEPNVLLLENEDTYHRFSQFVINCTQLCHDNKDDWAVFNSIPSIKYLIEFTFLLSCTDSLCQYFGDKTEVNLLNAPEQSIVLRMRVLMDCVKANVIDIQENSEIIQRLVYLANNLDLTTQQREQSKDEYSFSKTLRYYTSLVHANMIFHNYLYKVLYRAFSNDSSFAAFSLLQSFKVTQERKIKKTFNLFINKIHTTGIKLMEIFYNLDAK